MREEIRTDAVVIQDLDRPEPGPRGDADDAFVVVNGRNRSGDMGAVSVAVVEVVVSWGYAVLTTCHIEIGVLGDPGIEHRYVCVDACAACIAAHGF